MNKQGKGMVDIGDKAVTSREAAAEAIIYLGKKAMASFFKEGSPKGDVLETARVAGVMAVKQTPQIIPMCHPLAIQKAEISFDTDKKNHVIVIRSKVRSKGQTGVEMEALAAVSVAALTIYDMMKWADKGMSISDVRLLSKTGGKSGDYRAS